MKDSVINESLAFFNEIQSNLEAINIRKDNIKELSSNPELSPQDKQWILEEIRHINFLREDNARKVKQLNNELKKNGFKIKELEVMIESLQKDIQWKDEQIGLLQGELNNLDKEYARLFDAYQVQSIKVDELTTKLNQTYYAYGTEKELIENRVIEKKNGFIGFGKKASLLNDFNEKYFTEIDASKAKQITIEGRDIHISTAHPATSYVIEEIGNRSVIKIKDRSEFWKISKYLVVITN
jgi:chromosome segregation ATPase